MARSSPVSPGLAGSQLQVSWAESVGWPRKGLVSGRRWGTSDVLCQSLSLFTTPVATPNPRHPAHHLPPLQCWKSSWSFLWRQMGLNEQRSPVQEDTKGGEQGCVYANLLLLCRLGAHLRGTQGRMLKGREEGSICDSRMLSHFQT